MRGGNRLRDGAAGGKEEPEVAKAVAEGEDMPFDEVQGRFDKRHW